MTEGSHRGEGFVTDHVLPEFDWREMLHEAISEQEANRRFKGGVDRVAIDFDPGVEPVVVLCSDAHIGDWGTDYRRFEAFTDRLLTTPGLYCALLGDMAQMAIKVSQGVGSIVSNMLAPERQLQFLEDWIKDVKHKILFSTWDNHAVQREESGTSISLYAEIMKAHTVWFPGIGHALLRVNAELPPPNQGKFYLDPLEYDCVASHRFKGFSQDNPAHAPMRYMLREGTSADIAVMGDVHEPAVFTRNIGYDERFRPRAKHALVAGSIQNGAYGKRHFSPVNAPNYPAFWLSGREHQVVTSMDLDALLACRGMA
jgi:hypothetical protein